MIRDGFLKIASSVDLAGMLHAAIAFPNPLPATLAPNAVDLAGLRAVDKGQGYPLIARFDIEADFASADAGLVFTFGVVAAADPSFSGLPATIAQSPPLFMNVGILRGTSYELVVPKLPTVASVGRAYMGMCVTVISTTIPPGAQLFSGGVLSAYFTLDTPSEVPPTIYPSGWSL